jgi:uncharacterized protein DUF4123
MSAPTQTEAPVAALAELLFAKEDAAVYAVLDGASIPKLLGTLHEQKPEFCCLYPGELKPDMAAVAPYLVRLESGKAFTEQILKEGWGAHWGVLIVSGGDLRALRDHFREFHKVELPDQRTVIFRYYDPRVLRIFLPVCNEPELTQFFGPVKRFVVEGDLPDTGVQFTFTGQALKSEAFRTRKPA